MFNTPPVQTSYVRYHRPGYPGMLADEINWDADTRIVETEAGIPFGRAVSRGTFDDSCILGGSAFVGVSRADPTLAQAPPLTTTDVYYKGMNAGILTKGDIWVSVGHGSVAPGDAVVYDSATGEFGQGGVAIEGASWMSTSDEFGLAVLRLGNIAGNAP